MSLNVKTGISGFHDLCLLAKCRGKNIMQRLLATTGRHPWAHQRVLLPTYSACIKHIWWHIGLDFQRQNLQDVLFCQNLGNSLAHGSWTCWFLLCMGSPILIGHKNAIPHPLNPCFERIFCCTWLSIPCSCLKMNPCYPKATGMVDILILLKK